MSLFLPHRRPIALGMGVPANALRIDGVPLLLDGKFILIGA